MSRVSSQSHRRGEDFPGCIRKNIPTRAVHFALKRSDIVITRDGTVFITETRMGEVHCPNDRELLFRGGNTVAVHYTTPRRERGVIPSSTTTERKTSAIAKIRFSGSLLLSQPPSPFSLPALLLPSSPFSGSCRFYSFLPELALSTVRRHSPPPPPSLYLPAPQGAPSVESEARGRIHGDSRAYVNPVGITSS